MSAAAPWSVKGIDPKAREVAKDLARRSGMTLGEWLNSMIMEDEEEAYPALPRRGAASDSDDRRSRGRRLDEAYDLAEDAGRISASIDVIAARLEAAERRSTVAIQGVDQAVAGLVRRLDEQDAQTQGHARRIDDIAEDLREGHRRLRAFERETGPVTQEGFAKVEASLGALSGRLYEIEDRQRQGVSDLRERMEAVEKAAGPGVGSDLMALVGARLDAAQDRTTEALKTLERSFAELDLRMRAAESRSEPKGARDAALFEKLAEGLSRQIDNNRAEMMQRLGAAETGARIDRIERAVQAVGDQLKAAEHKSAGGLEAMGREVMRIARNLSARVQKAEADAAGRAEAIGRAVTETVGRDIEAEVGRRAARLDQDFARHVDRVDQRLTASDDRHALALEKLGGEITRISDQLSERIAQSERRSQQALEDIGRRLSESSDKIEQRYDRASGELAERMRMSEERTARLLAEARESIETRAPTPIRDKPLDDIGARAASAPIASAAIENDWRAAAFPDETFNDRGDWADEPAPSSSAAPFPTSVFSELEPAPAQTETVPFETLEAAVEDSAPIIQPFSGFGGADVDDALAATAPGFSAPVDPVPAATAEEDAFSGETEFVDPRHLRASMGAAAAAGRAVSTRSTIDAARAAVTAPADPAPVIRPGFGLKRGGKSKLQERLDRQAARDGSTVKKTLLASATAVALTGGVYGYLSLTDGATPGFELPHLGGGATTASDPAAPLAASAVTPTGPRAAFDIAGPGAADYEAAIGKLDGGDSSGLAGMTRAAELGYPPAQTYLGQLYLDGAAGVAADPAKSRQWGRRAAEGGDPRGMHLYGMQLYEGDGGATNQSEALVWLLKAAQGGLPDSQYNVARIYETGADGVAKNPSEALKWYMIAARGGDTEAQAAVTRLRPQASAVDQRAARTAADAFVAQSRPSPQTASQASG